LSNEEVMNIRIEKGSRADRIFIRRDDGTEVVTVFPKKGPIPHDAVHLAVERTLGLRGAFWGLVARGHHPEAIADMAKAAGHASASRSRIPDPAFVEAIQAERAVEAFEADHWSGGAGAPEGIRFMTHSGCEQSHVPPLAMDDDAIRSVRADIAAFASRWHALGEGEAVEVGWPE
jgi:hypothetical protein